MVKQLIVSSRSSRDARRHLPLITTTFVLGVAKLAEPYIPYSYMLLKSTRP